MRKERNTRVINMLFKKIPHFCSYFIDKNLYTEPYMAVNVRMRKAVTSSAAKCPEKKNRMDFGKGKLAECQSPSFLPEQSFSNKLNSFS